jgi:hypothetical protein
MRMHSGIASIDRLCRLAHLRRGSRSIVYGGVMACIRMAFSTAPWLIQFQCFIPKVKPNLPELLPRQSDARGYVVWSDDLPPPLQQRADLSE